MTEQQFEQALKNSIKCFGENYLDISEEECAPHVFSEQFEKKMKRLIRREKHCYYPLIKTTGRQLATAAVMAMILISTAVMSVEAWRNAFKNFLTEMFTTHTVVWTVPSEGAPTSFEDIYAISEVPEGFEITYQDDITASIYLATEYYDTENRFVIFRQWLISEYDVAVNTEGHDMVPITINECEGFLVNTGDSVYIAWNNGDYIFELIGMVSEDALIEIAKSVQKVE